MFGGCKDLGGGVHGEMLEARACLLKTRSSRLKAGSKALARILVRTILVS